MRQGRAAERGQHCAGKGKTESKVFPSFSSCAMQYLSSTPQMMKGNLPASSYVLPSVLQ